MFGCPHLLVGWAENPWDTAALWSFNAWVDVLLGMQLIMHGGILLRVPGPRLVLKLVGSARLPHMPMLVLLLREAQIC